MNDTITIDRKVVEQVLEALQLGQDAFNQAFGGYGYYRPENPHNFFPDPECCTKEEIANHSAACEAYDKGTYVPDHSDGWITPKLHVTNAPWGIGTYTDECEEISNAITALRAALDAAEWQEQCPAPEMMGEHACKNKSQCWEPCGDLGHSEAHVRVVEKVEPVAWKPSESATEQLWEALGRWSAYIASNGCKAELAPPQYMLDAMDAFTTPQPTERQEPVATVCYSSLHGLSIENHAPDILEAGMKLYTTPQPAIPAGYALVPVEPIKTADPEISREHLVAIAEKCGLLGAYRTREVVDAIVGYGQVILRDKAVQEAMYRASLAVSPKKGDADV